MTNLKVSEPWAALSRSKTKTQVPRCWAQYNTCTRLSKQWQKQITLSLKLGQKPHSKKPRNQEQRRGKRAICLQPSARWQRDELKIPQGYSLRLVTINLSTSLRPQWVDRGYRFFKSQPSKYELQREHRVLFQEFQGALQALRKLSKHVFRALPKSQDWILAW